MEQIQYLLDCINGRNFEEPDDLDLYSDQNSQDYHDCVHKPELISAATSPKDKVDENSRPNRVPLPKKKKFTPQGGKKHAVSQYKSPFVLDAERRAKERIRQAQAKKKGFQQPEWNLDTKVPILFDPNLKKQELFKLRPRNIQHGYEFDDGSEYLPSNTNDPTLLRRRTNASNNHLVVVGPTDNKSMTRRTFGFSPANNPMAKLGNNMHVPTEPHEAVQDHIPIERHSHSDLSPSPVRARSSSPRHFRPEYDHPPHVQQYPYHTHRTAPCLSANTSPVNSVDLDRCPSLFRPSSHNRHVNPYHTATTIDHHVATRATSPFEERELHQILYGTTGEESQAPYPGKGHFTQSPQHFDSSESDRPIQVPAFRPTSSRVSEVEYFTDVLREKLSKALSADKRKNTPKSPAPVPRSHTPPPPPPPVVGSSSSASGSEALMAGMGHLMAAVGDIITSTRYPPGPAGAALPPPYYYGGSPVGPPPAFHVAPPAVPFSAWYPTPSPSSFGQAAPSNNLFAQPPPRKAPIPFDLAGVCLDPSQHISGNFLQHTNGGKKARSKPGKSRTLSSEELLQGINFAPIGAPPVQSRSEMMDVILQKLQAIDQREKEIHQFLQKNTHSAQGAPFYPSNSARPLQLAASQAAADPQYPDKLLARAAQVLADYDPNAEDDDDTSEDHGVRKARSKHEDGVRYTPGAKDMQTYLSLPPQPKVTGVLHHNTYDASTEGVDAALISRVATSSLLPKGLDKNAKLKEEGEAKRDRQKEVQYLSQFPLVRSDNNMNDEVLKFMKDLDLTRQMKEVAFHCRGVTMAQVADTATEAIMCKLLDGVTEDVDGIIDKYSDKFIDKI